MIEIFLIKIDWLPKGEKNEMGGNECEISVKD